MAGKNTKKVSPKKPVRPGKECYSDIDSRVNSVPAQVGSIGLFKDLIRQTLDKSSVEGINLFAWSTHLIRQFGLEQSGITAGDVVLEVFHRGIDHLKAGKPMPVPAGWVNRALYLVVREKSKERAHREKCEVPLEETNQYQEKNADQEDDEILIAGKSIEDLKVALRQALRTLDPRSRRILYCRHVYGWDWQRIAVYLEERGEALPNLETLRQQACRTRRRLRHAILIQLSESSSEDRKN